ncbi:hypothetical protein RND81_12G193300 [Saponaria officinalis]|uniref:Uncharacterized protein n=1 Tax=Saponaria officinalis TaxID=3572 RepID=A0AAW1HCQ6_SAPOF
MAETEPAKLLLPYLQRADELFKHEPLVAYYCRLYAMEKGLKIPQSERTDTTNKILVSLIKQLEKDKKSLNLSPDDHLHVEGFALNVFAKADKQDRAGRADLNTAKTFYAASIFFEILHQFGELAPGIEQKQKYALWKAADIRKAIKEGRKPVAGPPGGEQDLPNLSETSSGGYDVEPKHAGIDNNRAQEPDLTPSPQFPDGLNRQASINIPPSLPTYPSGDYSAHTPDYPSHDSQFGHGSVRPENPTYPQPYQGQTYFSEPQHPPHTPQIYHPQDAPPPYTLPNFQSYPSFSESSLPATPSHQPSYYQGSDASYSQPSGPPVTNYASAPQYNSNIGNGGVVQEAPPSAKTYHYDSSYQPPPDKIAEAQKAARFAVGALAFDEVPVAVEHLRKALEYLTNPSAGH